MKIYGDRYSGNCYKILLLLSILEKPYEWIDIDILKGETKTSTFLDLNPNGKIPVLVLDDGRILSESNAILNYLAESTPLLPTSQFDRAKVLQWQFFEQYSHEPYIAVARFIKRYLNLPPERMLEFISKQEGGNKALRVMNEQLTHSKYFVGDTITIADISLFAYTHVADEGGFDLSQYPNVLDWINRIKQVQNFVPMG